MFSINMDKIFNCFFPKIVKSFSRGNIHHIWKNSNLELNLHWPGDCKGRKNMKENIFFRLFNFDADHTWVHILVLKGD